MSNPNGTNNNELLERLRIYDDQLSKFEQVREELLVKDKLISDLQQIANNSSKDCSKVKNVYSGLPLTPVSII